MIWTKDYDTVSAYMNMSNEVEKEAVKTALEYARDNLTDGHQKDDDEFIIIKIEDYNCVALITDEFNPIEICTRVFPFDHKGAFPFQEIEQVVQFVKH